MLSNLLILHLWLEWGSTLSTKTDGEILTVNRVSWENILTPPVNQNLIVHSSFDPNVGVLKLFPSITEQTIRNFLLPPLKGCVLETYGTGNAPDNRKVTKTL